MIDQNVRIDYGKLRHLVVLDKRLNGNFSYLAKIIETQETKGAKIVEGFPVERLLKPSNFISLLFYFGLLRLREDGALGTPNQTVRRLLYGYLREGCEDADIFTVDFWRLGGLIREMAYKGDWKPVFLFLAGEIERQTAVRDFMTGEKVIQTFLLAYLNCADFFVIRSEEEI